MPQSIIAVQTCWVWICSFKTSLNKGFSSRSTFWTVLKSRSFFFCINELSNACISPVTSSHITTHNRITTDCHTTQDTHDTTHTHTQINLGDACLATLNAKQAVPSELGSSGERSAPSPGSTQLPTAAKKHYYIQNGCRLKKGIILASVLHALLRRQSGWQ